MGWELRSHTAESARANAPQLSVHAATLDYLERNRAAWESWAPGHVAAGRKAWAADDLKWGIWGLPESELGLLEGLSTESDVIELGCGTAAISAWLARRSMRPVAVDFSAKQLDIARDLQRSHSIWFELVCENAEDVRFESESFDVAVSEYGVSLWSDPRRWLPEAYRLLRPNGLLVFFTNSGFLLSCTAEDGGVAQDRLVRNYFDRYAVEFDQSDAVEFHLTHSHWIELLRKQGFAIERLIEVRPPAGAKPRVNIATADWARRWPSEDVWIARKSVASDAAASTDWWDLQ